MHCHISGIEYGPKGEKNHLNLKDAKLNIKALLQSLKNFDCKGVVICESPNIEGDAKYMKDMFYSLS
jgi:deoxyribonuclease-4